MLKGYVIQTAVGLVSFTSTQVHRVPNNNPDGKKATEKRTPTNRLHSLAPSYLDVHYKERNCLWLKTRYVSLVKASVFQWIEKYLYFFSLVPIT